MKEIVPRDSRYVPITQQRWCCVPACVSMIMYRHKIPLVYQEELGYHLGLIMPKDELKNYWNARTGLRPPAGYGTQIFKKEYYPDVAFKKLKIPLKMIFHPVDGYKSAEEFKKYLESVEKEDKDVAVCFDYGKMYNHIYVGGHVSLIDRVDFEKDEVRLIDPLYEVPKWRIVKISKLIKAMQFHTSANMGGFWEFART